MCSMQMMIVLLTICVFRAGNDGLRADNKFLREALDNVTRSMLQLQSRVTALETTSNTTACNGFINGTIDGTNSGTSGDSMIKLDPSSAVCSVQSMSTSSPPIPKPGSVSSNPEGSGDRLSTRGERGRGDGSLQMADVDALNICVDDDSDISPCHSTATTTITTTVSSVGSSGSGSGVGGQSSDVELQPGQRVMARSKLHEGEMLGTLHSVESNGMYWVVFDDGVEYAVSREYIEIMWQDRDNTAAAAPTTATTSKVSISEARESWISGNAPNGGGGSIMGRNGTNRWTRQNSGANGSGSSSGRHSFAKSPSDIDTSTTSSGCGGNDGASAAGGGGGELKRGDRVLAPCGFHGDKPGVITGRIFEGAYEVQFENGGGVRRVPRSQIRVAPLLARSGSGSGGGGRGGEASSSPRASLLATSRSPAARGVLDVKAREKNRWNRDATLRQSMSMNERPSDLSFA
jgi:hypothetical protein